MDRFFSQASSQPSSKPSSGAQQPVTAASTAPDSKTGIAGAVDDEDKTSKAPLKGVVLGKDGKPCRTCTSVSSWMAMAKSASIHPNPNSTLKGASTTTSQPPSTPPLPPSDCPPDVETLGRSTWTLLHSIAAQYPPSASSQQQSQMAQFLNLFGKLYPCWVCAEDFQSWMEKERPRLGGRGELGDWMCRAHNEVNRKLGKEEFDCRLWEERWREGWRDGRCG